MKTLLFIFALAAAPFGRAQPADGSGVVPPWPLNGIYSLSYANWALNEEFVYDLQQAPIPMGMAWQLGYSWAVSDYMVSIVGVPDGGLYTNAQGEWDAPEQPWSWFDSSNADNYQSLALSYSRTAFILQAPRCNFDAGYFQGICDCMLGYWAEFTPSGRDHF